MKPVKKNCKAAATNSFRNTYWDQITIIFAIQLFVLMWVLNQTTKIFLKSEHNIDAVPIDYSYKSPNNVVLNKNFKN
jgi:hypothetical protein